MSVSERRQFMQYHRGRPALELENKPDQVIFQWAHLGPTAQAQVGLTAPERHLTPVHAQVAGILKVVNVDHLLGSVVLELDDAVAHPPDLFIARCGLSLVVGLLHEGRLTRRKRRLMLLPPTARSIGRSVAVTAVDESRIDPVRVVHLVHLADGPESVGTLPEQLH